MPREGQASSASNLTPAELAQQQLEEALGPVAQRLSEVLKGLDRVQLKFLLEALHVPDYEHRTKGNQEGELKPKWTDEQLRASLRKYAVSQITIATVERTMAEASLQKTKVGAAAAKMLSGLGKNARSILQSTVPLVGASVIAGHAARNPNHSLDSKAKWSILYNQSAQKAFENFVHLYNIAFLDATPMMHPAAYISGLFFSSLSAIVSLSATVRTRQHETEQAKKSAWVAAGAKAFFGALGLVGLGGSVLDGIRGFRQNRAASALGTSAARIARVHEELGKALKTRAVDAARYNTLRSTCRAHEVPDTCRRESFVEAGGKKISPCEWRERACRVKREYKLQFKPNRPRPSSEEEVSKLKAEKTLSKRPSAAEP